MLKPLENNVALITGSGKHRVGSHVADALAERGYTIVIHYRSSAAEAEERVAGYRARGIDAMALQADLSDEGAVRAMIDAVLKKYERLDVLVNTAGRWKSKKLEEITAHDVRTHFETNTLGTFLCSRQAGLAMVRQPEGGSIITFGDWAARRPYLNTHARRIPRSLLRGASIMPPTFPQRERSPR